MTITSFVNVMWISPMMVSLYIHNYIYFNNIINPWPYTKIKKMLFLS